MILTNAWALNLPKASFRNTGKQIWWIHWNLYSSIVCFQCGTRIKRRTVASKERIRSEWSELIYWRIQRCWTNRTVYYSNNIVSLSDWSICLFYDTNKFNSRNALGLNIGICVPNTCKPERIGRFLQLIQKRVLRNKAVLALVPETCQVKADLGWNLDTGDLICLWVKLMTLLMVLEKSTTVC